MCAAARRSGPDVAAARIVGLVGLGLVGQALGRRLRAQGWRTVGYDIRPDACDAFVAAGGEAAQDLAAMGHECEQVVLAVFDTRGVLDVLESPQGLLASGHRVRGVIDCSTGSPGELEQLASRLHARGIDFIESPLSGSSEQIGAGEAVALLGGDGEAIARHADLVSSLAGRRIHVGAAGAGARAKLATNLVLGLNRAVLAEGMAFAQALGIEPALFLQLVLATPATSAAAEVKGPLMVARDFAPRSRVRQHLKDVELMLAAAAQAGLDLPFSEIHARLMREAVTAGEGDLDNAAILLRLLKKNNDA
jgi:3-hydroxyisobutyrate dehydrogenase-like beta-hydroxyacid dehydrogenase